MTRKPRTGIYLTSKIILSNPDYVKALRDKVGLNLVILGFSGELPDDVLKASPYDGTPPSDACLAGLVARHFDGKPVDQTELAQVRSSGGPSAGRGGSNADFRRAVQIAREAGCEIWICGGSWTLSSLMFCPSNKAVRDWYQTLYSYWSTTCGVDGIDITHARYPMASIPRGLGVCACDTCAARAGDLGYDFAGMKAAAGSFAKRLAKLDRGHLVSACRGGLGPLDFVQILDTDSGLLDWLRFRCDLITEGIAGSRDAVRSAAGDDFIFGSDTYPASLSLLVGHDHTRWAECSDFASPLVSHVLQFVSLGLIEYARILRESLPALSEAEALSVVYAATGYQGLGLPDSIADYHAEDADALARSIPLRDVILHDLAKARLALPAEIPSYPIIHGEGWPHDDIAAIRDGALALGHDGVMWQGTAELLDYELK